MPHPNTATPLTESRIRRILDLNDHLMRVTKKNRKKFLRVTRLPDVSKGETLEQVVAPQMTRYFAGWNEDPAQFFNDRDRLLMIFQAIQAGGVSTQIDRYSRQASGELIRSGIDRMKASGLPDPAAAEEMLRQGTRNAESQLVKLRTITDAEVQAVNDCMKEIVARLFPRLKKLLRKKDEPA
jgi:hypothetical protein